MRYDFYKVRLRNDSWLYLYEEKEKMKGIKDEPARLTEFIIQKGIFEASKLFEDCKVKFTEMDISNSRRNLVECNKIWIIAKFIHLQLVSALCLLGLVFSILLFFKKFDTLEITNLLIGVVVICVFLLEVAITFVLRTRIVSILLVRIGKHNEVVLKKYFNYGKYNIYYLSDYVILNDSGLYSDDEMKEYINGMKSYDVDNFQVLNPQIAFQKQTFLNQVIVDHFNIPNKAFGFFAKTVLVGLIVSYFANNIQQFDALKIILDLFDEIKEGLFYVMVNLYFFMVASYLFSFTLQSLMTKKRTVKTKKTTNSGRLIFSAIIYIVPLVILFYSR